ncbi:MAG: Rho GTPase protein rac1 [Chaenotheca gracillima]|nr:MAG: Rho GTPase protein rac1 [Chaenotheca gracillima]
MEDDGPDAAARTTPQSQGRSDDANQGGFDNKGAETPFSNLRQLAGLIRKPATPFRRASSVGAGSAPRTRQRTPSAGNRTPGTARTLRPIPSRRAVPTTPHALRAFQRRRAAGATPGRDRRRSGRVQRETPRETLRALSRLLAVGTRPTEPSPQEVIRRPAAESSPRVSDDGWEEDDDGPGLPAPRLSLPLNYNDEDSVELEPPPMMSETGADDEDVTIHSVEMPRRAANELAHSRFSRKSFGGTRYSDRFADLRALGLEFPSEDLENIVEDEGRPNFDEDGLEDISGLNDVTVTRDLRQDFLAAYPHRSSDVRPNELPEDGEDNTFELNFAQPEVDERASSSPDPELAAYDPEDADPQAGALSRGKTTTRAKFTKEMKVSRHGIPYPSLPASVVKRMATRYARSSGNGKSKINKETLAAIMHATDLFLEQLSDDLGAYAKHARRKTIEESDMITLMKRQRQIDATKTPFSLAQRHLPRELLQDIRMAPPPPSRKASSRRLTTVAEQDEEEG